MTKYEFINQFHSLAIQASEIGAPDLAKAICALGVACAMNLDKEAAEALIPVSNKAMADAMSMQTAGPGSWGRIQ